jgi:hypothetical protein
MRHNMTKYTLTITIESLNIVNAQYSILARSLDLAVEEVQEMIEMEYPEHYEEAEIDDTQYLSGELSYEEAV